MELFFTDQAGFAEAEADLDKYLDLAFSICGQNVEETEAWDFAWLRIRTKNLLSNPVYQSAVGGTGEGVA